MLRVVAAGLAPAMLGFVVVAPDFVAVVLGHKWRSAVPVLQILAMVALAQCLAMLGVRVLGAINRPRLVFRFSILDATVTIAAFAVGLRWGIVGVSLCYAAVSIPLQVLFVALTARAVTVPLLEVCRGLAGVGLATVLMAAGCLGLRSALISAHVGSATRLVLVAAAGMVIYAAACAVLERDVIREIRNVRPRRGGKALVAVT